MTARSVVMSLGAQNSVVGIISAPLVKTHGAMQSAAVSMKMHLCHMSELLSLYSSVGWQNFSVKRAGSGAGALPSQMHMV